MGLTEWKLKEFVRVSRNTAAATGEEIAFWKSLLRSPRSDLTSRNIKRAKSRIIVLQDRLRDN